MSFNNEKREAIKVYMCEKIVQQQFDLIERTMKCFDISKQTVYRYLNQLINDNVIIKVNNFYKLVETTHDFEYINEGLEEDKVYITDFRKHLEKLPKNVQNIWYYAFTEMFNNAIDHSESRNIRCSICQDYIDTIIFICDGGVGIFNKIKEYYKYPTLEDAISELFKGKLTTDDKKHSGEGIFFTSRILDCFIAMSSGKIFTHDNHDDVTENIEDDEFLKEWKDSKGTIIYMRLGNNSNKELKEVFDMYADIDGGFNRTSIPIKNIYEHGYPVSRSQAKRLYNRFNEFNSIELDFNGVSEIGQGFAHELFVVFQSLNPDIQLIVKNENTAIRDMIKHVKNTI